MPLFQGLNGRLMLQGKLWNVVVVGTQYYIGSKDPGHLKKGSTTELTKP